VPVVIHRLLPAGWPRPLRVALTALAWIIVLCGCRVAAYAAWADALFLPDIPSALFDKHSRLLPALLCAATIGLRAGIRHLAVADNTR